MCRELEDPNKGSPQVYSRGLCILREAVISPRSESLTRRLGKLKGYGLKTGLTALLFALVCSHLHASPLHLQTQFAFVSESDFGPALAFQYERPIRSTHVTAVSAGRAIADNLFGWPVKLVAYASLQYFDERGLQPNIIGATAYVKAYKLVKLGAWQFPLRLGLGEGLSYAARIPFIEAEDFAPEQSAKLNNYLEWSMQTSLSYLLGRGASRLSYNIKDAYIGYSIFHRSTAFGLFADTGGGVNYMGIGVEFIFE